MNLNAYLVAAGQMTPAQLASAIGARSAAQVRQWQHGYAGRRPSAEYCVAIERATVGAVTRRDLRPDDWWLIWPELVCVDHPAPVPGETQEAA